jgi:diguanylate cyclase
MARILVVDDLAANRSLLSTVLRYMGHEPMEAADGDEALAAVRHAPPDLVICDVLMPVMDGYEFVRHLRAEPELRAIPVIFYTAYYRESEAYELAKACGVIDVLSKPAEPEQIIRVVDDVLARQREKDDAKTAGAPEDLPEDFDREHLRLVTDKLSEKIVEIQGANQRLGALIELNLQLAGERDVQRLLDAVCGGARLLLTADFGCLAVRADGAESALRTSVSGLAPEMTAGLGSFGLDEGPLGDVVRSGKSMRAVLSPEDGADGLPCGHPDVAAIVAAPISSLAGVHGWICVSRRPDANGSAAEFTEVDEKLLGIVAAQVGRVYEANRLYAQAEEHAADLEREVTERRIAQERLAAQYAVAGVLSAAKTLEEAFPRIAQICEELGFAAGALWRVDEAGLQLSCIDVWCSPPSDCAEFLAETRSMSLLPGESIPGRAWQEGRAIWLPDLDDEQGVLRNANLGRAGLHAAAAVPIVLSSKITAVIDFFFRRAQPEDSSVLDMLVAIGHQIGQFLQRLEQNQRIIRLNRVHAVLSGINSTIVRTREREDLLNEACRIAVEQGHFGMAWVGEVDVATGEVRAKAWAGAPDDLGALSADEGDRLPASHDVVDIAIRDARPAFVNDLAGEVGVGGRRGEALRRGYHSLIALPLSVEGRVAFVMKLYALEADFFVGEELDLLTELARDVSFALEYLGKQDQLAYVANYDVLTGLPNRTLCHERLVAALQAARLNLHRVAVVVFDIHRFRNINNTLGRQAGDSLLRQLARRLQTVWPEPLNVARIGSNFFAGIVSHARDATDLVQLLDQSVGPVLSAPLPVGDQELRVSILSGIAVYPEDGEEAEVLLHNAEAALRNARDAGVGRMFYRPEMSALIAADLRLENKLRRALENEEFVLHYQPKVGGATRKVTGVEALLRWNDPENGIVMPGTFIPLLEETGLILPVGAWAVRKALSDAVRWRSAGIVPPRIAVNVSALQLQQQDFVSGIADALQDCPEEASGLDLEITESMMMTDLEMNISRLATMREMGLNISIDDFGTGYSSLGYLARLPVNALKIDQSFILTMTTRPESMNIVSTIISLAHSLDLKVIAEGVETEEQAKFLALLKCDELQGYLISRPVGPDALANFMRQ